MLVNETTRFPDNDKSLEHAYDVGGLRTLEAGCAFHSVSGKTVASGGQEPPWREWAGSRSVPLACQRDGFRQVDDPHFLRVFEQSAPGLNAGRTFGNKSAILG